jgi:antagonist of KipI
MDATALRVANLLVGNAENTAGLEITLRGPTIRFGANHLVALTGADLSPTLNGQPVGHYRPVWVAAGTELAFGAPRAGSRTYLAISGGLALAPVLGSCATALRLGFGGLHGRALQAGDLVPCPGPAATGQALGQPLARRAPGTAWVQAPWTPGPALGAAPRPQPVIRALRGPEYAQFAPDSQRAFWQQPFTITAAADRMGYRLQGPELARQRGGELLSSAVTFGTVQVPASGQAIVLMADHQTTGGYARIAQAITVDFSALAQARPGQTLRFQEVSLVEAQALYLAQQRQLLALRRRIAFKAAHPR